MPNSETLTIYRVIQRSVLYLACAASLYALARFVVGLPEGLPRQGLLAGLGRPSGWRFFLAVLAPVAWMVLSLLAEGFIAFWRRRKPNSPLRAATLPIFIRWDNFSLLGLPLLALGMLGHTWLGDYHTILGVLYLAVVGLKTGILAWLLNRICQDLKKGAEEAQQELLWPALGQGLIVYLLYGCLALWTVQVVPCTAGEANYLFSVHKFLFDLGLMTAAPDDPLVWGRYYWGEWSWALVEPPLPSKALAAFLTPGYWLAGRTGALLSMSLLAGGVVLLFNLCGRYLGYGARRVLLAGWFLALSPAFWLYSQHISPELLGGLALALAMIYLLSLKERGWPGLVLVIILAAFMVWGGSTPLAMAVVLCLAAGFAILWRSDKARIPPFVVTASLAALLAFLVPLPWQTSPPLHSSQVLRFLEWPAMLAAVVFDQQQGILSQAPWFMLALAGWWFFMSRHSWAAASSSLIIAAWGLGALYSQWLRLEPGVVLPLGGFACVAPLMALWALPLLAARSHAAWRALLSAFLVLNMAIILLLNLVPVWRYLNTTGASPILMGLGNLSDAALYRLFPGFLNYYHPDMLKALPWAGLILLFIIWALAWRKGGNASPPGGIKLYWGWGLVLVMIAFAGFTLAGRLLPTISVQAELMNAPGAQRLALEYPGPIYLALPPGGKGGAWVNWAEDNKRLVLRGLLHDTKETGATLGVYVDGRKLRQVELNPGDTRFPVGIRLKEGTRWLGLSLDKAPAQGMVLIDRLDFE